ncbi:PREDICTED: flowering time control protein FPA-like [Tarenaya hassleriana]|uniref:flowering time control protein FPA-like n=1 Tax=Tarenaya hassleriana TaxID=28532 RepID=UPI00053CA72C|nr:PREDICTED: flowering time control protein FPA-like [Tarenaya hassleriana]XP_010526151.1 PREDICTED: flowering time control protein FPA-like [Tarenaya hassleriana]XP_010526159.1 PREDICTED: flowering time control protein FPA-like [Tarenaya hassleriana]XP_010526168.1 PREDICTED: flowering time control protein FPA-like [Tarenaya hassleriana]XP_010526176.1 PREDICTED: flowering time control protein FPA-like [Tarenaya hassleriana]
MAPVMKTIRAREQVDSTFTSNNLWVGSLSTDTTESDLAELFGRFGDLDRITAYSSRSFAFIYFRRVEDAVAAKETLQGTNLNGSQIKIEYARPAKPCKSLWVGGINPAVSKDDLEMEFMKFGKIEDFRFLRERRTAFIDFFELEDAVEAAKSMNGKRIGGSYLRVDFLRSQAPRREQWSGSYDSRDGSLNAKQTYPHSFGDAKGDGQPSNVLWIGYPPSVQIDEQMLHNAMILFGEIERIKSFPSRHFSLVEFRSAEEARHAKEGLQGRLFNDPRITITYSNSDLPPGQDDTGFYSGVKRSRPEMFVNDPSFVSSSMDYGRGSSGILGPMRPLRGSMERRPQAGAEYIDVVGKEARWRRPSPPGAGILPSPAQGMRPTPGSWEGYDPAQLDRETKRTRRDGSVDTFPPVGLDHRVTGVDRSYGSDPVSARPGQGFPNSDYIWRGIIAKGGTPVCQARCVPIGKGIETELPEVINCSARTGLDMLAKHYAEAIGFDIVFFLPDSEDDFASYTEFLRYLGSKNRAGVAKLDDGTTLFLVPPSDFLTTVLKVSGPERLYGVVLKLPPPPAPVTATYRQESQPVPPRYMDQPRDSPVDLSHSLYPSREDQALPLAYSRGLQEELKPPAQTLVAPTSGEPTGDQSGSKAGVTLTPELIATLATLLPATSQPAAPETHQPISGISTVVSTNAQSIGMFSTGTPLQGWKQEQQTVAEPANQSFQQFGNQYNPAGQLPPPPPMRYPPASSTPTYSGGMMHGGMQFQGPPPVSMPQQALLPSMPMNNYAMYPQNSQYAVSQPTTQQYQPEASVPNQNYGAVPGVEAPGLHGYPAYQQTNYAGVTSNQAHTANFSQPQVSMPSSADKANIEQPGQAQQHQSALPGIGQGSADGEVDKNQRYQSTLQFAANLLLQIQQQQQRQSDAPAGQGS